ncbi:MAG TPA: GNAT family N-acetyltransferase [Marmoricola sp.]|nr:GNAT family N-acetyltransferase [Marmoricola sp.]
MDYVLEFLDDPHAFLAAAGPLLATDPVRCTVIASVTARLARGDSSRPDGAPDPWWVVVRDQDGTPVSAGMRTAPLRPYPPYFLAMPDEAARLMARTLHERGESIEVVNGFVPTIDGLVAETTSLAGGTAAQTERTSLYELTDLVEPTGIGGRLRVAREDEVDLVQDWFDAFGPDASEQAGRVDPHPAIETRASTAARIAAGDVWIWETPEGVPAGVTAFNPVSFGVARVGPVYTPKEHRGHGYAAAGVAAISRRLLDEGARVCLFADEQNQTSTGVYVRLGYRPIAVTGGLRIQR